MAIRSRIISADHLTVNADNLTTSFDRLIKRRLEGKVQGYYGPVLRNGWSAFINVRPGCANTIFTNSPEPLTKSRFDRILWASSSTLTDHDKSANSLHVLWRILMLICPTCRNQNLDTAKFCGNCGNSFTRPAASTSSLINCAQGHVYSAVYEHCPYCPQPQIESRESDFATRVETPVTTIDPPRGTGPTV